MTTTSKPKPIDAANDQRANEQTRQRANGPTSKRANDTYKSQGASQWNQLTKSTQDPMGAPPSPLDGGLSDFANAFVDAEVKPVIEHGPLGAPAQPVPMDPWTRLILAMKQGSQMASAKDFPPVDLPPAFEDLSPLTADGEDIEERKTLLDETLTHYKSYLSLYEERKAASLRAIGGGRLPPQGVVAHRELLAKLEEAILFTMRQIDRVKRELSLLET